MKIIKNEKLIQRNGKIGQYTSLAALVVLGIGMYISFSQPEFITYSVVALILGFILSQVGMFMGARWGRSPRPDEKLDAGLKGLHSDFSIYHYTASANHLLVGPSGVWVLLPYHQGGKISYEKNRWKLKGGGFIQGYMRIFGQEGLGRPDLEAETEVKNMKKFFAGKMDKAEIPDIKPILVFTTDDVELEAGDSPVAAVKLKQLKELMRQGGKNRALTNGQIKALTDILPTP
jgi:hypothetical protein